MAASKQTSRTTKQTFHITCKTVINNYGGLDTCTNKDCIKEKRKYKVKVRNLQQQVTELKRVPDTNSSTHQQFGSLLRDESETEVKTIKHCERVWSAEENTWSNPLDDTLVSENSSSDFYGAMPLAQAASASNSMPNDNSVTTVKQTSRHDQQPDVRTQPVLEHGSTQTDIRDWNIGGIHNDSTEHADLYHRSNEGKNSTGDQSGDSNSNTSLYDDPDDVDQECLNFKNMPSENNGKQPGYINPVHDVAQLKKQKSLPNIMIEHQTGDNGQTRKGNGTRRVSLGVQLKTKVHRLLSRSTSFPQPRPTNSTLSPIPSTNSSPPRSSNSTPPPVPPVPPTSNPPRRYSISSLRSSKSTPPPIPPTSNPPRRSSISSLPLRSNSTPPLKSSNNTQSPRPSNNTPPPRPSNSPTTLDNITNTFAFSSQDSEIQNISFSNNFNIGKTPFSQNNSEGDDSVQTTREVYLESALKQALGLLNQQQQRTVLESMATALRQMELTSKKQQLHQLEICNEQQEPPYADFI